ARRGAGCLTDRHRGGRRGRLLDGGGRVSGRGGCGAETLALFGESLQLGLDLVEELVDLAHVVALAKAYGSEALAAHILRSQRHGLTSTSKAGRRRSVISP